MQGIDDVHRIRQHRTIIHTTSDVIACTFRQLLERKLTEMSMILRNICAKAPWDSYKIDILIPTCLHPTFYDGAERLTYRWIYLRTSAIFGIGSKSDIPCRLSRQQVGSSTTRSPADSLCCDRPNEPVYSWQRRSTNPHPSRLVCLEVSVTASARSLALSATSRESSSRSYHLKYSLKIAHLIFWRYRHLIVWIGARRKILTVVTLLLPWWMHRRTTMDF